MRHKAVLAASVTSTALAAVLWSAAAVAALRHDGPPGLSVLLTGAGTSAVIAAGCWLHLWRALADRDRALLIRTLARTVPLRRVP